MVKEFIPEHLDQLTPEWLTTALAGSDWLGDARVVSTEREILGDGEGFLGVIARLKLTFDREVPGAPSTLIAKLPQAANRAMGEMLGAYERESLFYEELASSVPVRTPQVYFGAFDRDRASEQQAKILEFVDRLPVSLAQRTAGAGKWIAGRKKRRYVLLMEDLAPARPGDQVGGGTPSECAQLLSAMAPAHAAFWGAEALQHQFWVLPHSIDTRMRFGMFKQHRKVFAAQYPKLIDDGLGRVIDWLSLHGLSLTRKLFLGAPETLVHGDLRLDNVFFRDGAPRAGDDSDDGGVIVFDWQLIRRGPAAYDVAYFLSGSLAPDTDPAVERELLSGYHDALVAGGVRDYGFEAFEQDYRRGLLTVLQGLSTTSDVELGDGRGVQMMDLWMERLAGRIRGWELDPLL